MKHNTSELTGLLLDAAVAKACGLTVDSRNHMLSVAGPNGVFVGHIPPCVFLPQWSPSTQWADGGPLIESADLDLRFGGPGLWFAGVEVPDWRMVEGVASSGPTPLIAAMRALVAAKLGGEVDLP